MHRVDSDHGGNSARQLSFPLATLTCAAFIWPLRPQLLWIFLSLLGAIVGVLLFLRRRPGLTGRRYD